MDEEQVVKLVEQLRTGLESLVDSFAHNPVVEEQTWNQDLRTCVAAALQHGDEPEAAVTKGALAADMMRQARIARRPNTQ